MSESEKNGLLVVDKPRGMTSFEVVKTVRRLADIRKVGHTGTLDPEATGVLPVALGRCTKLSKYLTLDEKRYRFTVRFGEATESGDVEGEVTRRAEWKHLQRNDVESVLDRFVGEIKQVPPVYSAIRVDGKRAYERARAGEDVELEARQVRIDELHVVDWRLPDVDFELRCGPGTYIRSLARDLGQSVDSAAHAVMIRRLGVGPFTIDDAVAIDDIEADRFWGDVLRPLEMVRSLPRHCLKDREIEGVRHGRPVYAEGSWNLDEAVALHDGEQRLLAVAECTECGDDTAQLWPRRVMIG